MVDPELPIRFLLDKAQMITIHPIDIVDPYILAALDIPVGPSAFIVEIEAFQWNR